MPAYRFEIASTGRAVCKGSDCKKDQTKIGKGELRFGSFVSTGKFESWSWKHWGCLTPVQIENLLSSIGGLEKFEEDPNVLDGYDEVDKATQKKIITALKEGHVPDQDWKGDPEYNRPGAKGMKARTPKKKGKTDQMENERQQEANESSPSKPEKVERVKKSKPRKQEPNIEAAAEHSAAPEKKKTSRKRKAAAEDDVEAQDSISKSAPTARDKKAEAQETTQSGMKTADAAPPSRKRKKKEVGDKVIEATQTTKKPRNKKTAKAVTIQAEAEEGGEFEEKSSADEEVRETKGGRASARGRPKKTDPGSNANAGDSSRKSSAAAAAIPITNGGVEAKSKSKSKSTNRASEKKNEGEKPAATSQKRQRKKKNA